jgi:hypothetical protein
MQIVTESPMCDLIPMKNNDKAYVWSCHDFSEEEAKLEKLACRLQTLESISLSPFFSPLYLISSFSDATKFKEAYEAAKKFNH